MKQQKVIIFDRGSSSESELNEMRYYINSHGYDIERELNSNLSDLWHFLHDNEDVKIVWVYDYTSLTPNPSKFATIISDLTNLGVCVCFHSTKETSLISDGEPNPMVGKICKVLDQFNKASKSNQKELMKRGYTKYIEAGGKPGRHLGYRKQKPDYLKSYSQVINLLRAGKSLRETRAICGHSIGTIRKVKLMFMAKDENILSAVK
jgi:DNA invertase Pin-like site-specific DNA recombinase